MKQNDLLSRYTSVNFSMAGNGEAPYFLNRKTTFGGFRKWWYPQIIHFNRDFHYKPSILGYPYFWKHPFFNGPIFPLQFYSSARGRLIFDGTFLRLSHLKNIQGLEAHQCRIRFCILQVIMGFKFSFIIFYSGSLLD